MHWMPANSWKKIYRKNSHSKRITWKNSIPAVACSGWSSIIILSISASRKTMNGRKRNYSGRKVSIVLYHKQIDPYYKQTQTMIYRSKAPLRIGLAGGGTDVSPYSDLYGGAILNASVSLYAHATIEPLTEPTIILQGLDRGEEQVFAGGATAPTTLPIDGKLDL